MHGGRNVTTHLLEIVHLDLLLHSSISNEVVESGTDVSCVCLVVIGNLLITYS